MVRTSNACAFSAEQRQERGFEDEPVEAKPAIPPAEWRANAARAPTLLPAASATNRRLGRLATAASAEPAARNERPRQTLTPDAVTERPESGRTARASPTSREL
jgi:hypothetical protein